MLIKFFDKISRIYLAETKIVFDIIGPGHLPPEILADNKGLEELSCGIYSRAQTGWSCADNYQVIKGSFRAFAGQSESPVQFACSLKAHQVAVSSHRFSVDRDLGKRIAACPFFHLLPFF